MEERIRLQGYEPFWEKWRIKKLLHEGSMSNIYQVESENSTGIIKVIPLPKIQADGKSNARNLENAEAMQKYFKEVADVLEGELDNLKCLNEIPNVLVYQKYKVYERKEEVGFDLIIYMDMEQNLVDYVAEQELDNEALVRIVKGVAWVLDKAHKEGIVHKDIKAENIFMTETGESMLADFSLARKVESFQSRNKRRKRDVYTAPEVLSEYDFNNLTDIYALGVVLYLLLNNGKIPTELTDRTAIVEIPDPERAGERLAQVVKKAIAYRGKDRYQSAEEFFQALNGLEQKDFSYPETYMEEKLRMEQLVEKEKERQRQEALAKEREEKERQEALEKEQEEKERQEALERERKEKERQEALEREREEKECQEALEREREEKERQEALEREREEKERQEALEREREEKERQKALEREREEKERQEALEREREEKERQKALEREREEKERQEALEREQAERRRQEALAREEALKERQKEELRLEAEKRRRELAEERNENVQEISGNMSLFGEETLAAAAEQLNSSLAYMQQITEESKREIEKEEVDITLKSDENEYGGFFDFSKSEYKEYNTSEKNAYDKNIYDKNIEEEPYERKMADFPKEKKNFKPLLWICCVVFLVAVAIFISQNDKVRAGFEKVYENIISYISSQDEVEEDEIDID